ncbi:subunit 17 of mediator complex-domain-containing protein [Auriculariales sp. MPI-PUGE-AT-0066]|nr:subunit 17 of mediator complex-domain-containing protein [Auriculariales sp. MPI-PUGE-AT-0066]
MSEADVDRPFKKLKLSLEPPYKDDNGERILQLVDITIEGERVYKPREEPVARMGDNLKRIITERGTDFFERYTKDGDWRDTEPKEDSSSESESDEDAEKDKVDEDQPQMTVKELIDMRHAMMQHLFVAEGEMRLAHDMLGALVSTARIEQPSPIPNLPAGSMTGDAIARPEPIPSVKQFNAQLALGAKDQALRKASDVLRDAAGSLERTRKRDEAYWISALTARSANWEIMPAPLPPGAAMGNNADPTARDFMVSFGLEESPPEMKTRTLAFLAATNADVSPVFFPARHKLRLRISLTRQQENGTTVTHYNTLHNPEGTNINSVLQYAQQEAVDQEVYTELLRDAQRFPTADVRVSERIIVLEVTHGITLGFSMVNSLACENTDEQPSSSECDLIHSCLHLLLLRRHSFVKRQRTSASSVVSAISVATTRSTAVSTVPGQPPQVILPSILQPVIDVVRYRAFCGRLAGEMRRVAAALHAAKVQAKMRMTGIGESGSELVALLNDNLTPQTPSLTYSMAQIGGEAVLRIGNRQTIRLTFQAPSILHAVTSQANVKISSIPQLAQILQDEVELVLLDRICDLGKEVCDAEKALWFVDRVAGRTMGRWNGHSATFQLSLKSGALSATAWTIRSGLSTAVAAVYNPSTAGLFLWANNIVRNLNT